MGKIAEIEERPAQLQRGALDDLFIEYYLETANQTIAYKRACKAGGHPINEYAAQYGRKMYKRLAHKISDSIDKAETEDAALARMALRKIVNDKDASDQAVIAAAKELSRKRADKLEISKPQDIDTIEAKILLLEKEHNDSLAIDVDSTVVEDKVIP